jgi:carboxypeptidase PM20D1
MSQYPQPAARLPPVDSAAAIERLRAMVRVPTVSRFEESDIGWEHFESFVALLPRLYPATHNTLRREVVAGHSLLYRWEGTGTAAGGRAPGPTVLMAHYDVVAADQPGWRHPPFEAVLDPGAPAGGTPAESVLWGRGTLDDKGAAAALFEAVESWVLAGFQPAGDLYLSLGHDEETTGSGASAIVDLLAERGVRPALVIDEGGAIVHGVFPGVAGAIAVVGVSEKGICTVRLSVDQVGGHASTPPRLPATVRLARAVTRLNRRRFPAGFTATNLEMMRILGGHGTGVPGFVFRHAGWFRLPLLAVFGRLSDETNAIVRTTAAVTQLTGSAAANALPEQAQAIVNVRVAAGSSVAQMMRHLVRAVHDPLVRIEALHASEPSPTSPTTGAAWDLMSDSVLASYPGTIVTPYVMLAASDGRHFTRISTHVYRFTPFEMSNDERGTLHAVNERIRVSTYLNGITFYQRIVRAA